MAACSNRASLGRNEAIFVWPSLVPSQGSSVCACSRIKLRNTSPKSIICTTTSQVHIRLLFCRSFIRNMYVPSRVSNFRDFFVCIYFLHFELFFTFLIVGMDGRALYAVRWAYNVASVDWERQWCYLWKLYALLYHGTSRIKIMGTVRMLFKNAGYNDGKKII